MLAIRQRWLGVSLALGALLVPLAAGLALWVCQSRLIFEPERVLHARPVDFPFPVLDLAIPVKRAGQSEEMVRAWWIPAADRDAKVVLYLHGNDGNVSTSMGEVAPLRELGYSILVIDYRGYGISDGSFPSEAKVYQDAEAAWTHLVRAGVDP
jgi:pimeloyl-ACP methyl ester carboxylesterase